MIVFVWHLEKEQEKLKVVGSLRMKLLMLEMAKLKICNNHQARACTIAQVTNTFC